MDGRPATRGARRRWSTASELLRLVHTEPGITRTQARHRLRLPSGTATELVERLRAADLLAEERAPSAGRGRPTTVLAAHPRGPLVVVVELATPRWQAYRVDLTGTTTALGGGEYGGREPGDVLDDIARVVAAERAEGGRVRAVVVSVAGLVSGTRLLQFTNRGWSDLDLAALTAPVPAAAQVRLLVCNDAALSGLAEARTGSARSARVVVHVLVSVGLGGTLLIDGRPVTGAHGAAGEFGHQPLGDPALRCPCGARGCWDLMVDGRAMARYRGDDPPEDPVAYASRMLDAVRTLASTDPRDRQAVRLAAAALGAGLAGLVNAHDPDVVTLAGLAPGIRATAPDAFADAYRDGLMDFHRRDPPPVRDGMHQDDGPVRGAAALAVDAITAPEELERWATRDLDDRRVPGPTTHG